MRVLVLHGPNLNLLGARFEALNAKIASQPGFELEVFQANSEGALIDELHRRREWLEAVIVNPTSLAPVAFALAEALALIGKRSIEAQLVEGRSSALHEVVEAQCHGEEGYLEALEILAGTREAERVEEEDDDEDSAPNPPRAGKSIGRKAFATAPAVVKEGSARKTIGKGTLEKKPIASGPLLSREGVKTKIKERLAGSVAPEALASWARTQWQALISGASVEPGQKDLLEDVLLGLAASAKANEHTMLAAIAKLDR